MDRMTAAEKMAAYRKFAAKFRGAIINNGQRTLDDIAAYLDDDDVYSYINARPYEVEPLFIELAKSIPVNEACAFLDILFQSKAFGELIWHRNKEPELLPRIVQPIFDMKECDALGLMKMRPHDEDHPPKKDGLLMVIPNPVSEKPFIYYKNNCFIGRIDQLHDRWNDEEYKMPRRSRAKLRQEIAAKLTEEADKLPASSPVAEALLEAAHTIRYAAFDPAYKRHVILHAERPNILQRMNKAFADIFSHN